MQVTAMQDTAIRILISDPQWSFQVAGAGRTHEGWKSNGPGIPGCQRTMTYRQHPVTFSISQSCPSRKHWAREDRGRTVGSHLLELLWKVTSATAGSRPEGGTPMSPGQMAHPGTQRSTLLPASLGLEVWAEPAGRKDRTPVLGHVWFWIIWGKDSHWNRNLGRWWPLTVSQGSLSLHSRRSPGG